MNKDQCKHYLTQVLARLQQELTIDEYNDISDRFKNAQEIHKFEKNYIYVIVEDSLTRLLIEKFNSHRMDELLQEISNQKLGFKYITKEDAKAEKENSEKSVIPPDRPVLDRSTRRLRAEFTFDNFVIGEANRFAYLTATKVAESPYAVFNPLYMFGDVGLGKTHLMMAIGHYILDRNINANVVYTSAQQFAEDYFIYTNKENHNIEVFYNKYRQADILLVDDIQFLEDKKKTQEEFFKVFDFLHENNKQIVITSDRKATDLNLMSRLKSRFGWGMPVDIKTPDRTTRINILKRKLEILLSNPNDVPVSCLEVIADMFTNNIRELEGALRRFVTYCVSFNIPFTDDNVHLTLDSIAPKINNEPNLYEDNHIKQVKKIVIQYFQISEEDLISASRKPSLVYARNLCYYIIRKEYNTSLKRIGDSFGNKEHTTVTHGFEKIKEAIETDSKVKSDVLYIKNKL